MATRSRIGKTTIVDIAAASGVSVTTVSRILNDKPDVADETRERVLRVMDEIGFAPQSAWRQIRSGRSGLIGVHAPQDFNPTNMHLVMAAALGVEDAGYSINIITRSLNDTELLGLFRSREVDGMILLEVLSDDHRPVLLRDHGYPFVMVGHDKDNTGLNFADVDIDFGMEASIGHLAELGHRSVACIGLHGIRNDKKYAFITWARDAYEKACRVHDFEPLPFIDGLNVEEMSVAAQRMLDNHPEVTAFLALQEASTIAALRAAQARGLRIPDDLSLVAMLSELSAEIATPPLTTIAFPAEELGSLAARMLLDRMTHGHPARPHQLVKPTLTIRESTARVDPAGSSVRS